MDPVSTSSATPGDSASSRQVTPRLDAINLMLRDLHTRHDEIRHRAAFRGCTSELLTVQQELVDYLLSMKNSLQGADTPNPEEGLNYNSFT
jgi:hypothetical protein